MQKPRDPKAARPVSTARVRGHGEPRLGGLLRGLARALRGEGQPEMLPVPAGARVDGAASSLIFFGVWG